jgi:hypothetical protein
MRASLFKSFTEVLTRSELGGASNITWAWVGRRRVRERVVGSATEEIARLVKVSSRDSVVVKQDRELDNKDAIDRQFMTGQERGEM